MTDARAAAVEETLTAAGELGSGDTVTHVTQLAGGWSRHSYLAHATRGGAKQRYIVRVKPRGALLDTDLGVEFRVYSALHDEDVATPAVYGLESAAENAFGGPYFVMEHVDGHAPNMYGGADRERLEADWRGPRGIAADMVDNLARIHRLPAARLPDEIPELGFLDVVARWRAVYEDKRLLRDPVVEEAFDWLAANAPADTWPGLVHGDYRVGNMMIADGRVRAILDWELTYRGDVRFDLGYLALARAAGKHLRSRSPLMGTFADEEWFLERYSELTGRAVDRDAVRAFEMLAITMLLATQFTAVWMYAHGRTTDFRMAWSRFSFAGLRQDMTRLMRW